MTIVLVKELFKHFSGKSTKETYYIASNSGYDEADIVSAIEELKSKGIHLKTFYEGLGRWEIKNY